MKVKEKEIKRKLEDEKKNEKNKKLEDNLG